MNLIGMVEKGRKSEVDKKGGGFGAHQKSFNPSDLQTVSRRRTGPKSSDLAYLFIIFLFRLFIQIIFVYKKNFNSYYFLRPIS